MLGTRCGFALIAAVGAAVVGQPRPSESVYLGSSEAHLSHRVVNAQRVASSKSRATNTASTLQVAASSMPPLSPPPFEYDHRHEYTTGCLSHDLFNDIQNAVNDISSPLISKSNANDSDNTATRVVFLSLLFCVSLAMTVPTLMPGDSIFVMVSVTMIFYFFYAVLDVATWHHDGKQGFLMCVMPLLLTTLFALGGGALCILYTPHNALLACASAACAMYVIRDVIVAIDLDIVNERMFDFYWLGVLAVALGSAFCARHLPSAILTTYGTIWIGAYGTASSIAGLVVASGGQPLGIVPYVFILLGILTLGCIFERVMRVCCLPPAPSGHISGVPSASMQSAPKQTPSAAFPQTTKTL